MKIKETPGGMPATKNRRFVSSIAIGTGAATVAAIYLPPHGGVWLIIKAFFHRQLFDYILSDAHIILSLSFYLPVSLIFGNVIWLISKPASTILPIRGNKIDTAFSSKNNY